MNQTISWIRRRSVFLGVVIVPTLLASGYYGLVASPQYQSEAGLLSDGSSGGREDTYVVHEYVMPHDSAPMLRRTQDLARIFNEPGPVLLLAGLQQFVS
ncbi:hypothetical protein Gbth_040_006 [Gluconobacter thailandicus F149-1 = NBRC 100600]|uniref:Polysaccharide chain length determinant N-terminal domain-containing protein n=1 Tax=Gluconobacter thailandicus NBRC 3257 TaxID=1381097 RepID=A0ABQ0J0P4_GLUTH|nr:hypothetical protein [Gluconobacter thailandicus]AFW00387.1 hypothetical protein B932_0783 [Gluconobacter oxydans H24]ANQ40862.1 hypothetical protein BAR24_04995 [Gluconobacter oxydans]GAN90423.1 hypothetical protein Gbfr_016_004 [Gluconobacter frateurii M-2]GAC89381.1 hypothetical protein NBRC3255_3042 [Gluconobacter thailandicus NBRC 3255]GAD28005.1 hypothetical protein NBRC3257_3004 [Gluconobacter thailandicus NBRC 3257]